MWLAITHFLRAMTRAINFIKKLYYNWKRTLYSPIIVLQFIKQVNLYSILTESVTNIAITIHNNELYVAIWYIESET